MHGEAHCMSQATFREVLFGQKVHRKLENCGAQSCFAGLLRIAVSEVNSSLSGAGLGNLQLLPGAFYSKK